MINHHNISLVLIRFLGLIGLLFGVMWLVNLVLAFCLTVGRIPEWIMTSIWGYTVQGFLSGPIWLVTGIMLLKFSHRLARFLTKGIEEHSA